jgi:hypothetical protein
VHEPAASERGERERNKRKEAQAVFARGRESVACGGCDNVTHPHVSPQVGSSPSHIKLPTKAHTDEMSSVAGTKTLVPITTGATKTRRRRICAYETAADTKVRMTSRGTVCSSVWYGTRRGVLFVTNRSKSAKK